MDLTILHFNDVYNVEENKTPPFGGAARFCTALKELRSLKKDYSTLTLFSGDCFSPSNISTITQGDHIPDILNEFHIDAAVYGNHDFDFGVDKLLECVSKTNFPWLNSNVVDSETLELFADGKEYLMFEKNGIKVGIIGLVEKEWVETLSCVDVEDVIVKDFCLEGRHLARKLKHGANGADIVIALTHMRWPNDRKLAQEVPEIDLVLGGHDHDFNWEWVDESHRRIIIKSGTDFKDIGKIDLKFDMDNHLITSISIEHVTVSDQYEPDSKLESLISESTKLLESRMDIEIGRFGVDLDARFSEIRSRETAAGNVLCDICLTVVDADVCLINSGTVRADRIIPAGPITYRDLSMMLPIMDPMMVLEVTGEQLLVALENGVSKYPALEGRFPMVGGIQFQFSKSQEPGNRVIKDSIKIQDDTWEPHRKYRVCVKEYMARGKDGYDVFIDCPVLVDSENGPILSVSVQNYLRAIQVINGFMKQRFRFRSSVVSLTRRKSIIHDEDTVVDGKTLCHHKQHRYKGRKWSLIREKILETEKERCEVLPKVEGRIVCVD